MTFTEWQMTRAYTDNLAAVTGCDHETWPAGFTYSGGSHIEAREWGFGVVIETSEREFSTLEEAETYLWKEWARDEING